MKVHKKTAVSCLVMMLAGCASMQQGSSQQQPAPTPVATNPQPAVAATQSHATEADGAIVGTPAKNSKFAKLKIGMGKKEVEDLIGPANDMKSYATGKAWIPFYFGKDAYRFETFYKKEGSLTFEGGGITGTSGKLIRVTVDVNSTGYARTD